MSLSTGTTHLGLAVNVEELEHDGIISGNSKTLALLKQRQDGVDWTIKDLRQVLQAEKDKVAKLEIQLAGKKPEEKAK